MTLPLAFDGKTPVEAAFVLDVLETRVLRVTETGAADISESRAFQLARQ